METHNNVSHSLNEFAVHLKYNIIYININSLRNKLCELELMIESYKSRGITVHFIALTEVRLDDAYSSYYNLSDYNVYFCNKQINSGGVALYCHKSLTSAPLFHASVSNVDLLCISVGSLNIRICVIYKQPTVPFANFFPIIDSFLERYRGCIVIGDFNIDLLKTNLDSCRLVNNMLANGYYLLNKIDVDMATRVGSRDGIISRTIIDHAMTDITQFKFHLNIHATPISDHNIILLSFDSHTDGLSSNTTSNITTHKIDFNKFRNLIINNPYIGANIEDSEGINNCINFMKSQFNACTTTKQSIRPNTKKPWISQYLLDLIAERNQFYCLHKKYPNNNFASEKFKHYKILSENCRKSLRNRYFANTIMKNMCNAKKLWSTFNLIIFNKQTEPINITTIRNAHNIKLYDDIPIANELNNYFTKVGADLAYRLQQENNHKARNMTLLRHNSHSMFLNSFSSAETVEAIKTLRPNAFNNDEISANIIKNNIDIFSPLLTNIINNSFKLGQFPDPLKVARLIPLFKSGDPTLASNYRPISILPAISKISEKLLYNATESFLKRFQIINKYQFGFQKGSGSLSATSHFISNIQKALDNPKYKLASGIFIDLQKAFDSIPHDILIEKLYRYGIRGLPNQIFKSYLSNRGQYVSLRETRSDIEHITFGTPQGSNLGPLIFLLYINDIFDLPLKGTINLFADDAVIYYSHYNIAHLYNDMQHDLNLVHDWLYNNLLTINIDKTKYMIFHSHQKNVDLSNQTLLIKNFEIERVHSFKYLGLHLQSDLKWNTHIDKLSKKISPMAGILYKLNKCTPSHLLRSIYFAHIHSKLVYLCPVWGSASPQYILNDLQILQNKAIRNIFHHDYYIEKLHTNEILAKYRILNISQIIRYETTLFFFKIYNNLIKNDFTIIRNHDIHNYPTRNRSNIHTTRCNTNYGMFNVYYSGARLYNALNVSTRAISSINLFKKRLREIILSESGN